MKRRIAAFWALLVGGALILLSVVVPAAAAWDIDIPSYDNDPRGYLEASGDVFVGQAFGQLTAPLSDEGYPTDLTARCRRSPAIFSCAPTSNCLDIVNARK